MLDFQNAFLRFFQTEQREQILGFLVHENIPKMVDYNFLILRLYTSLINNFYAFFLNFLKQYFDQNLKLEDTYQQRLNQLKKLDNLLYFALINLLQKNNQKLDFNPFFKTILENIFTITSNGQDSAKMISTKSPKEQMAFFSD